MEEKDSEMKNSSPCEYLGTIISSFYDESHGPWGFATPPINPSRSHSVLYEYPVKSSGEVPKPRSETNPHHWDDEHVRMPYSPMSLYIATDDEKEEIRPRWEIIMESLLTPISTVEELENAIRSYNTNLPELSALRRLFNQDLDEEESRYFFDNILPEIVRLALRLPELVPGSIPLLRKGKSRSISMSQMQIASLLANAFLCTFVWKKGAEERFPVINFVRLFMADQRASRQQCVMEKLKSIIHYFQRVTYKNPTGVVTFERKYVPRQEMPRWDNLTNELGKTRVHVNSKGRIEDSDGFLQVDFANKMIGGGVLGYGCVQEEVRFVINPELLIARLFTEELGNGEALVVIGTEQFSKYTGYGDTFNWVGNVNDQTPLDEYGRRRTTIVAIDATRFVRPKDQFHCSSIIRELNKAYVGFSSREKNNLPPVASGNWGCGAFMGNPHLKALIQLMACSAANRDLIYYTFGDESLMEEIYRMYQFIAQKSITIADLWRYLSRFCASQLSPGELYAFVQQCHFDRRSSGFMDRFFATSTKSDEPISNGAKSAEAISSGPKSAESCGTKNKLRGDPVKSIPAKRFYNNNNKLSVSKKKDFQDPTTSDELISLINLFDGVDDSKSKKEERVMDDSTSLLSEIDKVCTSAKPLSGHNVVSDDGDSCEDDSDVIEDSTMETDDSQQVVVEKVATVRGKNKKITDFFSKKTNR